MPINRRFTEARFNLKNGTIKPVDLEKLSKPVADFGRHLNFVFDGTPYGINSITDYTNHPIVDAHSPEDKETYAHIRLCRLEKTPGGVNYAFPMGHIQISRKGKALQVDFPAYVANWVRDELRGFESQIKNYNLSAIKLASPETLADACDRKAFSDFERLVKENRAFIDAIGTNYDNGLTTLSIGREQINKWADKPAAYLVVPNSDKFYLSQILKKMPEGAMSVERAYPKSA